MDLSLFLKNRVIEFIDNIMTSKEESNPKIRDEEYNLLDSNKDYEEEIKKHITKGEFVSAKRVYRELLEKFEQKLERDVAIRLLTILNRVTDLIKTHIRKDSEGKIFENEFEKYKEIINNNDILPKEIKGEKSNVEFFKDQGGSSLNDEEEYEEPIEKQEEIKADVKEETHSNQNELSAKNPYLQTLKMQIKTKIRQINGSLISEDLSEAQKEYNELKILFQKYPSDLYEEKIELYSDVLSANFSIHQLEEYLKKVKNINKGNELLEEKHRELLNAQARRFEIEKKRLDFEIEDMKNNLNKKETLKNVVKTNFDKAPDLDVDRIKELAKIDRLQHDMGLLRSKRHLIKKAEKPQKIKIDDNEKSPIANTELIKKLYSKGLKNLFRNEKEKAKNYFEKILNINPFYKPAIIRLEQIKAKT